MVLDGGLGGGGGGGPMSLCAAFTADSRELLVRRRRFGGGGDGELASMSTAMVPSAGACGGDGDCDVGHRVGVGISVGELASRRGGGRGGIGGSTSVDGDGVVPPISVGEWEAVGVTTIDVGERGGFGRKLEGGVSGAGSAGCLACQTARCTSSWRRRS